MPDLFVATKDTSSDNTPASDKEAPAPPEQKVSHTGGMSVFSEFPGNIQFENQEPNEIIHLFLRRHLVTNVRWISLSLVLAILPFFVPLALPLLAYSGIVIPGNFIFILLLFYYLIILGYVFTSYVSWFYNIGIVTNMRVVDIDLDDITTKNVAATEMEDLIDVDYRQQGFLQNFFDYGNVHIQIEGLKPNFEFLSVPHPAKVADVISDLMREVKHET